MRSKNRTLRRARRTTPVMALAAVLLLPLFALPVSLAAMGRPEAPAPDIDERRGETDELVIYSYGSLPGTLRRAIQSHFEEQYGVEVDLQRIGETGAVYTQLYLERNNPQADVVIGLDATYLPRIEADNLLEPYRPAGLEHVDSDLLIDPQFRAIPFDHGHITLNYDSRALRNPPASWDELLEPRFENGIIMLHPGTSSPGRNFLLYTIAVFGEDGYLDYWRALRPNILTVTAGWSDGYGLYTQGEAPMVVSYETSPAYHREFEETDRYDVLLFDDAAYLQIELAGIVRGARNRLNAERLMDYLLSDEFQQLIPLSQFMYPVHGGVELPQAFLDGPRAADSVSLDADLIAERFQDWLADWEEVMR